MMISRWQLVCLSILAIALGHPACAQITPGSAPPPNALPRINVVQPMQPGAAKPPMPIGQVTDWLRDADYMQEQLNQKSEYNGFGALEVSNTGIPTACAFSPTRSKSDFDQKTCDLLMQRARFTPATDSAGKAVKGTFYFTIDWRPTRVRFAPTAFSPRPPAPRIDLHAAKPLGRPGDWVTNEDYPTSALRAGATGTAFFRLTIGIDGVPSDCEITRSTNYAELDQTTCDLMKRRARFTPATDAAGKPIVGSYSSATRWVIPGGQHIAPLPVNGHRVIELDIMPDGAMANCKVTLTGRMAEQLPKPDWDAYCCQLLNSPNAFVPVPNAAGKPVKRHVVMDDAVSINEVP